MFVHERHKAILDILKESRSIKTSYLVQCFNVSLETIRRDLEHLEKEGLLKRVHGGAVLEEVNSQELTFTVRETKYIEEKQELARLATNHVKEGQSIALDVSTTNTEFAKALKEKFVRLTVLTNSLPIAIELSEMENYTIILPGGVLRNKEQCILGEMAESYIEQFHIETFFMSASGISLTAGITDYGIGEIQVKKKMLQSAQKIVVLADSSKFDVISLVKVCDLSKVEKIITDAQLKNTIIKKYQELGVEVVSPNTI